MKVLMGIQIKVNLFLMMSQWVLSKISLRRWKARVKDKDSLFVLAMMMKARADCHPLISCGYKFSMKFFFDKDIPPDAKG